MGLVSVFSIRISLNFIPRVSYISAKVLVHTRPRRILQQCDYTIYCTWVFFAAAEFMASNGLLNIGLGNARILIHNSTDSHRLGTGRDVYWVVITAHILGTLIGAQQRI